MHEVMILGHKKNNDRLRTQNQLDKLKWETAKELGLENELSESGGQLSAKEAGRIGGNMTRKLVKAGERALYEEGGRKAVRNLEDDR